MVLLGPFAPGGASVCGLEERVAMRAVGRFALRPAAIVASPDVVSGMAAAMPRMTAASGSVAPCEALLSSRDHGLTRANAHVRARFIGEPREMVDHTGTHDPNRMAMR